MALSADISGIRTDLPNVRGFQEWFDTPVFLSTRDLPYLPPEETTLVEKSQEIVNWTRKRAEAAHEQQFAQRARSGFAAWAGPPGAPENRPIAVVPEDSGGDVFSWIA